MRDPWAWCIEVLHGAAPAAALHRWPVAATRRHTLLGDDAQEPPPEERALEAMRAGVARVPDLAAALGLSVNAMQVRLCRMQRDGLVKRVTRGRWRPYRA